MVQPDSVGEVAEVERITSIDEDGELGLLVERYARVVAEHDIRHTLQHQQILHHVEVLGGQDATLREDELPPIAGVFIDLDVVLQFGLSHLNTHLGGLVVHIIIIIILNIMLYIYIFSPYHLLMAYNNPF